MRGFIAALGISIKPLTFFLALSSCSSSNPSVFLQICNAESMHCMNLCWDRCVSNGLLEAVASTNYHPLSWVSIQMRRQITQTGLAVQEHTQQVQPYRLLCGDDSVLIVLISNILKGLQRHLNALNRFCTDSFIGKHQ